MFYITMAIIILLLLIVVAAIGLFMVTRKTSEKFGCGCNKSSSERVWRPLM
jgi:hypothetical protein